MTAAAAAEGAEALAAAGGAGGGGAGSPVSASLEAKIDLTHGYNRMVDSWFDVWTGDAHVDAPQLACAYPGGWSEAEVDEIRDYAQEEHFGLRWHMSVDSWAPGDQMDWDLRISWTGLTWDGASGYAYQFIDNVVPYVEMTDAGYGWKLYVKVHTGHPNFHGGIAALPVYFDVKVTDGGNDIKRMSMRGFTIYGDGSRQQLPG